MRADIKQAVIDKLIAASGITDQIGSAHKKSWGAEPGDMILLRMAGAPGEDQWAEIDFHASRMDIECYGNTPDSAYTLWRKLDEILRPKQGGAALNSFTIDNCRVVKCDKESGPGEFVDDVTKLPYTLATYTFVYTETS